MRGRRPAAIPSLLLLAAIVLPPATAGALAAEGPKTPGAVSSEADALEAEGYRLWDDKAYDEARARFREALALRPSAETYRALGWLCAETDRHDEAVAAFRAAIELDPSLEPELRFEVGEQLLWAEKAGEAVPLLESVRAARPRDRQAARRLALAYRWSDRHRKAEALYRALLAEDPGDAESRTGLGWALLWQDRYRAASREFSAALEANPKDPEALVGLSRARLFLDLPEEAAEPVRRALEADPRNAEARAQERRVTERLFRGLEGEFRVARDSDELTIASLELAVSGRPARGLDLEGSARQLYFRQGFPGKTENLDDADQADGLGGAVAAAWRPSPAAAFRAGLGTTRYDVGGFRPWSGHAGATWEPRDLVAFSLDWERTHFNTIRSFQEHVTADTFTLSVRRNFRGKLEVEGSTALIRHHNDNESGQPRENRGWQAGAEVSMPLYRKEDGTSLTGIARLRWLAFKQDLDVGVFDPERYATELVGVDGRWECRPRWELFATLLAGAQQEIDNAGSPTYEVEGGVERKIGGGSVALAGFATDSSAGGPGGGFWRRGAYLRFRIPF